MKLNEEELDALTEFINIGVGRAAQSLSKITGSRINLSIPHLRVRDCADFQADDSELNLALQTAVEQGFSGDLSGRAMLAFPKHNALELARIVGEIPTQDDEMDEELYGVLEEIGNIVLNAILGSISNLLECTLSYSLPTLLTENTFSSIVLKNASDSATNESTLLVADTSIKVADRDISGSFLVVFETGEIEVLLAALTAEYTA